MELATRFEDAIRRVDGILEAQAADHELDLELAEQAELSLAAEESWQDIAARKQQVRHGAVNIDFPKPLAYSHAGMFRAEWWRGSKARAVKEGGPEAASRASQDL